jgi:hypothetical protein
VTNGYAFKTKNKKKKQYRVTHENQNHLEDKGIEHRK